MRLRQDGRSLYRQNNLIIGIRGRNFLHQSQLLCLADIFERKPVLWLSLFLIWHIIIEHIYTLELLGFFSFLLMNFLIVFFLNLVVHNKVLLGCIVQVKCDFFIGQKKKDLCRPVNLFYGSPRQKLLMCDIYIANNGKYYRNPLTVHSFFFVNN